MIQTTEHTHSMRRVEPERIEHELDGMWRENAANALMHGGVAGTRNSVLTLVIYTQSDAEAQRAFSAIEHLTGMHPSRAIVVVAEAQQAGDPLEAYVATYTAEGGSPSYGEKILLKAHDSAVSHLPGVVLPLIVSGLPASLWWTGDPPWLNEQLEALVDGSDRFLVDTSEMRRPEQGLVALEDLTRRKQSSCAVSDFNWTRQAAWREQIAGFFDEPELRDYLAGIDRVTIEYAAGAEDTAGNTAQAYLLAGWLASRLDWRVRGVSGQGGEAVRAHTLTDVTRRTIELEISARYGTTLRSWLDIVPEEQGGAPPPKASVGAGALMSVHLHARLGERTGAFAMAREPDLRNATTLCTVPNVVVPSRTVHLASLGEAALLGEQLQLVGHDAVYLDALRLATQLLGPGARRGLQ